MTASANLRPVGIRVPASTSNLGSGFDTVGLALDRYLTAAYEPGAEPLRVERMGTLAGLSTSLEDDVLATTFAAALADAGIHEPTGVLRADSAIPIGMGLGSSAAAVVAGLGLAAAALGHGLDREAIFRQAEAREGHPDNAAPSLLGGLVAIGRDGDGHPHPFRLPISPELAFAYAAPGTALSTTAARAALPGSLSYATAVRGLGRVAALIHGLETADAELLRVGFTDEIHVRYRLPLIPGGEAALDAAMEAGALAATISGAGSGLIAVCRRDRAQGVAEAMAMAFRDTSGTGDVVYFSALPDLDGAQLVEAPWR